MTIKSDEAQVEKLTDAAQRLALSSRSLRLGAAGAPYSTVIDHARRDHALAREDALPEQVAERLGFQSIAAFTSVQGDIR